VLLNASGWAARNDQRQAAATTGQNPLADREFMPAMN